MTEPKAASSARSQWVLVCAALTFVAIPVNFVLLNPASVLLNRLAIVVLTAAAAWSVLGRHLTRVQATGLSVLLLLAVTSTVAGTPAAVALSALMPVALGLLLPLRLGRTVRFLGWSFAILASSVLVEVVLGAGALMDLIGTPLSGVFSSSQITFRARGLIGQPVPAAVIVVALGTVLTTARATHRLRTRRYGFIIAISIAVVLASGTRSAAVLFAVAVGLVTVASAISRRSEKGRFPFWATVATGIVLTVALPAIIRGASQLRVFDIAGLAGSVSLTNRMAASDVLSSLPNDCDFLCLAAGRGPRDLQMALPMQFGRDLSTVDNFFVTLLWDYGVLGLLAVTLTLLCALRSLFKARQRDSWEVSGALGIMLIVASFAFFDSLYTRPVAFMFGVFIGLLGCGDRRSERPTSRDRTSVASD